MVDTKYSQKVPTINITIDQFNHAGPHGIIFTLGQIAYMAFGS